MTDTINDAQMDLIEEYIKWLGNKQDEYDGSRKDFIATFYEDYQVEFLTEHNLPLDTEL